MKGKCKPLFPRSKKHFLLENALYIYGESEFNIEDSFQKKRMLYFVNHLGYFRGVIPLDKDGRKCMKRLIYISILMGTRSREGRWIAFGRHVSLFILHR